MGPNLLVVLSSFNSGVPVKATKAALGSACFIRIWFSPPWLRWPSSISTIMSALWFTHSGILVAVLNFWISEKMIRSVPLPICSARRLPEVAIAASLSFFPASSPPEAKVLLSWVSRSTRSVTTTIRHCFRLSCRISALLKNTIVNDLPEPVVCQITPPSRPPVTLRVLIRSISRLIPNTC